MLFGLRFKSHKVWVASRFAKISHPRGSEFLDSLVTFVKLFLEVNDREAMCLRVDVFPFQLNCHLLFIENKVLHCQCLMRIFQLK